MSFPRSHDGKLFKEECKKAINRLGASNATEIFVERLLNNNTSILKEEEILIDFHERLGMAIQEKIAARQEFENVCASEEAEYQNDFYDTFTEIELDDMVDVKLMEYERAMRSEIAKYESEYNEPKEITGSGNITSKPTEVI